MENEPPSHDGQTLGHVHSKFWSVDAFVAADSNSFSPSVGRIPKFYGHHRHSLPPDDHAADPRGNEEARAIAPPGESAGIDGGHATPCRNVETTNPTAYDLCEVLLGADAFTGYLSPSTNEDTLGTSFDHPDVALSVHNNPGSTLLPEASPTEHSMHPDDSHDEAFSGSESCTDLEFTLTNYAVSSMSSPLDTIDDFLLALRDLEFIPATSCYTSKDFVPGFFDSTTGRMDLDLGSLPGFSDVSNYMTSAPGESSAFHESLHLQGKDQDPMGDSINLTDCSGLLSIDVCLGTGADIIYPPRLAGFEFCYCTAPTTTGHEFGGLGALGLSLVNLNDPTTFTAGFGGLDVSGEDDDVKEAAEGVDSSETWWTDALDTMFF